MIAPWITEPPDVDVEALVDALDPQESVKEPWYIQSPGDAEWAMGRLSLTESELAGIEAQRSEWQQQLDDWHDAVMRRPMKRRALFVGWLTDYARRQREETGTATLTLPGGKVTSRRNPAKLLVTDPEAVLAWARQCAVEVVKEVVRLDELRRMVSVRAGRPVSQDGEVVAGLDVEPEHVSYSVKVVAK
jgi:ribosomal protein L13E